MFRFLTVLVAALSLSACANIDDLSKKPLPIGEFALGHNIVVAPNLVKGPVSREASKEEWIASVTKAIGDRFGRYDGDQLYHFGVSLEGYVLAQPGIPLVLSPKSALIIKITVWDDAAGKKLNAEPEQLTALESIDGDSIVGSGLTKTAEEQMEALSINIAKVIQRWITQKHREEKWFKRRGDAAPAQNDTDAPEAKAEETAKKSTPKEPGKDVVKTEETTTASAKKKVVGDTEDAADETIETSTAQETVTATN